MIIVDVREEDEVEFLQKAGQIPIDIVSSWQGPSRAPSTSRDCRRIIYAGTVKGEGAWAARVSLLVVKENLGELEAVVGLYSTFANNEAILIDLKTTEAAVKIQSLVEDAVLVTPTLMVARSTASESQWKRRIEEIFADYDNAYVEKVRYRPSCGGGLLAVAPALKEQKDRKRFAAKGNDGKELQVVIRLSGEFVGVRANEGGEFVRMIRSTTGVPLQETESTMIREAYQWTMLKDARFGWRGDILLRVAAKEEVLHMFGSLEGKAINVPGGGRIIIEVMPHISLLDEARARRISPTGAVEP